MRVSAFERVNDRSDDLEYLQRIGLFTIAFDVR